VGVQVVERWILARLRHQKASPATCPFLRCLSLTRPLPRC
jgi:hypothetical protein